MKQNLIGFGVAVVVAAVMMAMGASRDAYMGVMLGGVGVFLAITANRYRLNPTYTDTEGKQQTAGPVMLTFLAVLGVLLVGGGLFVGIHGLE